MRRLLFPLFIPALACTGLFPSSEEPGTTTTHVPATNPTPINTTSTSTPVDNCETSYETPAPEGCVVGRIACGETIQASTHVGNSNFGDDFYVYHFCSPQRHDYDDSPEVAYMMRVPSNKKATVTVSSECADLDVAVMSWETPRTCPTGEGRRLNECEMRPKRDSVSVATVDNPQEYMVVVDGRNGSFGNFTLSVECNDYR